MSTEDQGVDERSLTSLVELCPACQEAVGGARIQIIRHLIDEESGVSDSELAEILNLPGPVQDDGDFAISPKGLWTLLDWVRLAVWFEDDGRDPHPAWIVAYLIAEKCRQWGITATELELLVSGSQS